MGPIAFETDAFETDADRRVECRPCFEGRTPRARDPPAPEESVPCLSMADDGSDRKVIATNRRARYEYEILDTLEAGVVLQGPEVKSLRAGKANLAEAYATIRGREVFLIGAHIPPYPQAGRGNPDPLRERKLLLHRSEIMRLQGRIGERGLTLIPLQLYFKGGRAKLMLAVARGKRRYDKRQAIRQRESEREIRRSLRARGRSRS